MNCWHSDYGKTRANDTGTDKRCPGWAIKWRNAGRHSMRYWWLDDRPQRLQRLLLGVYQGKKHIPIGRVGTGFPRKLLDWLVPRLKEREVKESPFAGKPLDQAGTGCRHRDDELDQ